MGMFDAVLIGIIADVEPSNFERSDVFIMEELHLHIIKGGILQIIISTYRD